MENDIVNVEVLPDTIAGGWRIDAHYEVGPRVNAAFGHFKLKYNAKLVARGVGMALGVEVRVKNRKGQYTSESSSYGNDPISSKG